MSSEKIGGYLALELRIISLKAAKYEQEEELKQAFADFIHSLSPAVIVKDSLHELAVDKGIRSDLAKTGINMGANFLIKRIMGKPNTLKGFLGSVLVDIVSNILIRKNGSVADTSIHSYSE